ncbi:hypothetical protein HYU90_00370 [Candidatus Collierbacteria bacterium]|nr:hypothetical protein [Candidatus Collierbacteria bacterium]
MEGRHIVGSRFQTERLRELQARAEKYFPGAKYAAVYSHTHDKIEYVPISYAIASQFGHATDYGSGIFEGGSAIINERTGEPNIILQNQRLGRLYERSLPARGYQSPVSHEQLAIAIKDLIYLDGLNLFRHPDGVTPGFVRAYIRPSLQPASSSGYGISLRRNYPIDLGIIAWAWPDYLPPELAKNGGAAAITGKQRLFPITGKHASNYGEAVRDSTLARTLGSDELVYLAPYLIDEDNHLYWSDPNDQEAKLTDGVIADGPGEECLALTSDQRTLVYPPMRVNRLGGTVLQYIVDHLAVNLGLDTCEADITLRDLRAGKYAGMAMVGNAVKVTPVRLLNLSDGNVLHEQIELFSKGHVPEMLERLRLRWEDETRGLIDPSHSSLLTPAPLSL